MTALVRIVAEILRALLFFTRPYSEHVLSYVYRLFMGKTKPLPPIKNKILLMSATELAAKIRHRELKCEDVMQAFIERCSEVNPHINAVVDDRYEDALEDAKAVDRFLNDQQKSPEQIAKDTPLLGVPFSCKEAIGVKDMAQTCGIVRAKGRVAEKDSESAALYRKAGAIPVTVTNVPELSMWWESANLIYGMPRNPYNNVRTVGGSSGGEGALLTSAGAVIGIGNDIAGSIRIPAGFCGIYGHKPSTGLVSNIGFFPSDDQENEKVDALVSTGPMCRYADDLPLLMKILVNDEKKENFNKKVDFHKVKIYYMEEFPGVLVSAIPAIKKAIRSAASYFEKEFGIKPIQVKIDEFQDAMTVWECKLLEANCPPFKTCLTDGKEHINLWLELLKSVFRQSEHTLPAIYFGFIDRTEKDAFYEKCLQKHNNLEKKLKQIFAEDSILLLPTSPEIPPHYLMTIPKYANCGYTSIMSTLGLPATAIPASMCMGMPISIQAISGRGKDHLTIAAALELDKFFGGWKSPCPISVS